MTYTQEAVLAVVLVVLLDRAVLRTGLTGRRGFWTAYAIVLGFQLLVNGVLTGYRIVTYDEDAIVGGGVPRFLGDGRVVFAPVEDLLFGFALVLMTSCVWVWLGRRGIDR